LKSEKIKQYIDRSKNFSFFDKKIYFFVPYFYFFHPFLSVIENKFFPYTKQYKIKKLFDNAILEKLIIVNEKNEENEEDKEQ
jgi:hypothetical protein